MKTLVMTTIFVVTVVINAFGGNIQENFAYNEVMNGNQVESQIVYKVENGKFLQNHLKYNFTYDAQGRTIQKEALRWNEIEQAFERFYCLNYNYTEGRYGCGICLVGQQDECLLRCEGKSCLSAGGR